jgi:hypothetical protein
VQQEDRAFRANWTAVRLRLPLLAALVALVASLLVAPAAPAETTPFTDVTAFATKTGFRAVVAWSATERVAGVVRYGTDPAALDQVAPAPGAPDTAQLVILDGLTTGATYHYVVEDLLSGAVTPVQTFEATNAYTDYDEAAGVYTLDLLVQLDSQSLPEGTAGLLALEDIATATPGSATC